MPSLSCHILSTCSSGGGDGGGGGGGGGATAVAVVVVAVVGVGVSVIHAVLKHSQSIATIALCKILREEEIQRPKSYNPMKPDPKTLSPKPSA